jgi:ParB family chromosome partitioning protein
VSKEKRLGRGLEALLGRLATKTESPSSQATSAAPTDQSEVPPGHHDTGQSSVDDPYGRLGTTYEDSRQTTAVSITPSPSHPLTPSSPAGPLRVPIQQIESNPFQPRRDFDEDEIQSLSDSLRAHGLLQPIVVRSAPDGFQLVAGERRLRAAAKAGWSEVPVQVVEADDRQLAELALVENLQRKDLNALEKAASFQRYLQEYGSTQEELAARLKLDRSTISNFIRLLELPEEVQQSLRDGTISQGHARSLLPLGDEPDQVALCRRIHEEGLSVRQTEALVQEMIERADAEPLSVVSRDGETSRPRRRGSEHVASLEQQFRAALGTRVKITHSAHGKGKLVIQFGSHEEFERIRQHICGPERPELESQAG